jgi:hypothetical protein
MKPHDRTTEPATMSLRPLLLDAVARTKIMRVRDHAERNHYRPETDDVPGNNPACTCELDTYRCVFTYTKAKGRLFRHLLISVPGDNYANPVALCTIATEFGFTGWDRRTDKLPKTWCVAVSKDEHCAVVVQEI